MANQAEMVRKRLSRKTQIVLNGIAEMEDLAKYGPVNPKWVQAIEEVITARLSLTLAALKEGREDRGFTL